jgi:hypothetical protein
MNIKPYGSGRYSLDILHMQNKISISVLSNQLTKNEHSQSNSIRACKYI